MSFHRSAGRGVTIWTAWAALSLATGLVACSSGTDEPESTGGSGNEGGSEDSGTGGASGGGGTGGTTVVEELPLFRDGK